MSNTSIKEMRLARSKAYKDNLKKLEDEIIELNLWKKGDWNIIQDIALDVEAVYAIKNDKLPVDVLRKELKREAKVRFSEYPEIAEKIIKALPSKQTMWKWRNTKKWTPAIWEKCKVTGLFTKEKKAQMIDALFRKGIEKGDVNAIKTWLTVAGEYTEKTELKTDKAHDIFREINETLHKKK